MDNRPGTIRSSSWRHRIMAVIAAVLVISSIMALLFTLGNRQARLPWQEIIVAGDDTYPPFEFVADAGTYSGFNIDVMHALSNELGIKVTYRLMPWSDAIIALEQGQVDALMGMFITSERRARYDFAYTRPYVRVPQAIFVRAGETRVRELADLAALEASVQEDDLAHNLLVSEAVGRIVLYENQRKALQALAEGSVDAHVGNQFTGQYYAQHDALNIVIAGQPLDNIPYGMAVKKENKELHRALDRGLRALRVSGVQARIERIWFGQTVNRSPWADRTIWGLVLALFISLGFLILLGLRIQGGSQDLREINQQLQTELQERTRTQGQLYETLGQLETLMQSLQMGVVVEDDQRRLRYANHRAWRLLGLDEPDDLSGEVDFQALAAERFGDSAHYLEEVNQQLSQETVVLGYRLQHVDGRSFLRDHIRMHTDGQSMGHLWLYHDATAQERNAARLRQAYEQQLAINRLAIAIGQATSTQEACRILFEHANPLLAFDVFIVSFVDPEKQMITAGFCALDGEIRTVADLPPIPLSPEGKGTQSTVIHTSQPAYIPDLQQKLGKDTQKYAFSSEELVEEVPDDPGQDMAQSALYMPMIVRGIVTGVIQIQSYQLNAYSENDMNLLSVLSNVAAAGIQNLRLYQSSESRAQQLALVNRIARSVGAALAMDDLLDTIYYELAPIMHADAFTVALYDDELDEIDFRLQIDKGISMPRERVPLKEGLIAHVIRADEPLLIPDYAHFDQSVATPEAWGDMQAPESWLGVPMRIGARLVGVVCVQTYEKLPYKEEDLSLLSTIADQIAVAIERARLYDAIRDELAERERLEEQLRQSHKMEAVGQLAGGIAHDFNNLLTVINGYSQLALENLSPEALVYGDIQAIHGAGLRAARLTRQLLAFSRRQMLRPEIISLNDVVEGLADMLQRVLRENISLQFDLAANLGAVVADPGQIEQVLLNLAVNAGDAMPEGGQLTISTKNVAFSARDVAERIEMEPGAYVQLSVVDDGIGMSEEVQEHLFEPFYTTKEVGKGTGLGLATVYGIIAQSGGHIHCTSAVGQGTTFDILLPCSPEEGLTAEHAPTPQSNLSLGHETLLLVEDERSVRELLRDTLQHNGYKVIEASNGQEALHILQTDHGGAPDQVRSKIQLLISDVVMPQMSGINLLDSIREQGLNIKAILMSGYHDYGHEQVTEIPGKLGYMQKPFSPMALAQRVREILDAPTQ